MKYLKHILILTIIAACSSPKQKTQEYLEGEEIGGEFVSGIFSLEMSWVDSPLDEEFDFNIYYQTDSTSGNVFATATVVDRTETVEIYLYNDELSDLIKRNIEFTYTYSSDSWTIKDLWPSDTKRIEERGTDVSGVYKRKKVE